MIHLVMRSIWNKKWSFILTTIVSIVSLIMLSLSIYIYENSVYCHKVVSSSLTSGTDTSCVMYVTENTTEAESMYSSNYIQFKKSLSTIKGVTSHGEISYNEGMENFSLSKLQCKLTGRNDEMLHFGYIENSAIDFYKIPLSEGKICKDMPKDNTIFYVYLGSAYKKYYKLGDTITCKEPKLVLEEKKQKTILINTSYIVKGFIKDNTKFVYPETFDSSNSFVSDKCYETLSATGVIIEFSQDNESNRLFVSWKKSESLKEMKNRFSRLAKKYDYKAITVNISQLLKEKESSNREINNYILKVLGIIIAVTVTMMICIQISAILNNTSEYGILYANGYTTNNITIMIIIEAFTKLTIASAASLSLVRLLIKKVFLGVPQESEVFHEIFNKHVISGNIFSALLICAVSIILPLMIIRHKKPVELIGGNDT